MTAHPSDWLAAYYEPQRVVGELKDNGQRVFSESHREQMRESAGVGDYILDRVQDFLRRYVAFPTEHALVGVTLWVAHTHVFEAFESTPRLALLSPEPGSGKTRVLEVCELLVPRPMHALNASAAPIFRSIETACPTLLFDEVDALFTKRGKDESAEDMRALLNAGHRQGATVPRCVGPRHDVAQFPVYAPAALAGLGDLPETLLSRSVIIRMRRRGRGEQVTPFRRRIAFPDAAPIVDMLSAWLDGARAKLAGAWPDMPDGVADRNADVWEPLLAIADLAGGDWPDRARLACTELCKVVTNREASLGVKLLTDLRDVWGDHETRFTETLLELLHALEESPWADFRGKPLDSRGLAWRLGKYEIGPTKVKIAGVSKQGYRREDLWDAWERYCPPSVPADPEPPEPAEPPMSDGTDSVPDDEQVPEPHTDPEPETAPLTSQVPEVPQVPDPTEETPERTVREHMNYWLASCGCGWKKEYATRAAGWEGVKRHHRKECA